MYRTIVVRVPYRVHENKTGGKNTTSKFSAKELEGLVLATIKDLGVASLGEVMEYMAAEGAEIEAEKCNLYIERWRGRSVVAITYVNGELRYKIKDVPPWFASVRMTELMRSGLQGFNDLIEKVKEYFGDASNPYHDYRPLRLIIETLDPILGGIPEGAENTRSLKLRRKNGSDVPVIASNQIRAWHRDNFPLVGIAKYLHRHIAFSDMEPIGDLKSETLSARVLKGFSDYEAIPAGTRMMFKMVVPCKGKVKLDPLKLKELYDVASETPIRGLGANPFVYGGHFKLIEMEEL